MRGNSTESLREEEGFREDLQKPSETEVPFVTSQRFSEVFSEALLEKMFVSRVSGPVAPHRGARYV